MKGIVNVVILQIKDMDINKISYLIRLYKSSIITKDIINAFEELQKMSRLVSSDRKHLKQVLSTTRPSSVTISIEAKPTFSRSNPINK